MAASKFGRFELRTRDLDAARRFYSEVLGAAFWSAEVAVIPLPERAAAMGAPAHWLGHIEVGDVETTAARIVALGGQHLGPVGRAPDGVVQAVLRDPFGAVMAVSSAGGPVPHTAVAWHLLNVADHQAAFALYAALFGWQGSDVLDLGPQLGQHQNFTWDESGRNVGSVANTARLPHVHTHWLFHFRVTDIDDCVARVRARGGKVLGPMQTASGDLVATCDDPQGAAFALYQFAHSAASPAPRD